MKGLLNLLLLRSLFLVFLLLCSPLSATGKVLVGVIMTGDVAYYQAMHRSFADGLRQRLPAGKDVQFILQRPFPDPIAWSNAARKLIAVDVDLIVSYGSPATQAVLFEKSSIPVVYAGVYNPAGVKLKGENVTGCGFRIPLSSIIRYYKRLKYIDRLQVIYSSTEEDSVRQMDELVQLARQQKISLSRVDIRSQKDLKKIGRIQSGDVAFVSGSSLAHLWLNDIIDELHGRMVPAVGILPDPEEHGMLFTLFQPPRDQGDKAAELAAKIIGGESPRNLPPEVLRKTELVLNLVQAKELGITFPIQLIVEATKVIK